MPLSSQEIDSKAQMLVNDPGYVIPSDIQGLDLARIEGRATVIRNQNAAIARFNRVPAPEATQEPSTMGGKSKKMKKSKKNKKNKQMKKSKKNKSRR